MVNVSKLGVTLSYYELKEIFTFYDEPIEYLFYGEFKQKGDNQLEEGNKHKQEPKLYYSNFIDYDKERNLFTHWIREVDESLITKLKDRRLTLHDFLISEELSTDVYVEVTDGMGTEFTKYPLEEAKELFKEELNYYLDKE